MLSRRSWGQVSVVIMAALLGACTHEGFGSQTGHYATFSVPEPKGRTIHVCHAYGCRERTRFTFTDRDVESLRTLMVETRGTAPDTPEQERRAVAYAIGWMERRVGDTIGTKDDRAGMDFTGSGDRTQQDCVDEATNTTSYLNVLAATGLIRHHTVGVPFAKENYLRGIEGWTHWTAVLEEKAFPGILAAKAGKSTKLVKVAAAAPAPTTSDNWLVPPSAGGQRWAVDSWIYANGENPAVVRAEEWYISSLDALPAPTR